LATPEQSLYHADRDRLWVAEEVEFEFIQKMLV
jgi:hypothetical protein